MTVFPDSAFVFGSRRVSRFVTVGALGFVFQLAALAALTSVAHWPWLPATIVAVELAVVHNFLWHERWTWRDRSVNQSPVASHQSSVQKCESRVMRLVRFNVMTGLTSIAGNAVLMAVYVGVMGLPALAGNVLAVATLSVLNFIVSDRLVFRSPRARPDRTRGSTSSPRRPVSSFPSVLAIMVVMACACSIPAAAAPHPETIAAWDRYVASAESRIERERVSLARSTAGKLERYGTDSALKLSACSADSALIRCDGESIAIPSGTISRWRGSVFVPGISLDQLLHRLRHPGTPPPQDDVAASRVLARTPDSLRVYIRLVRSAIVTVTYDTEHDMRFQRWAPALATARSVATRIDEVGGSDHGFLWRLNSYWHYRQTTDGVVVELESLTLSRHVPAVIRPIAAPIVTRIARESMVGTLGALRRYAVN